MSRRWFHNGWLQSTLGLLLFLGAFAGGIWALDGRYARAGEVRQQFTEIKVLLLEDRLSKAQTERRTLTLNASERALSRAERERLGDLDAEIERFKRNLERLNQRR